MRERFATFARMRADRLRDTFRAEGIDALDLDTGAPYLPPLMYFFKNRKRRR